ncbi:MAG: T9SS type A sorting domain-containing protein [Bacteroidales bacterium]|nr:T9SS type A sorting domain-containing protein [Bacteroidales bacterium]MCF6341348.1 T9SS type A sorting domain-containing protein [Bacteroidales bacterium]
MKNYLLLFLCFLPVLFLKAQTLPNSNLESWENVGTYEEPVFWNSPNQLTSAFGAVGVTKSEDAYSGNYAARLETIDLLNGLFQAPGLITLADLVFQGFDGVTFSGGFFLRENVSRLRGMYKYSGLNGDSASVVIYNFRHPAGEELDTIGSGFAFLHDTSGWAPFEVIMVNKNDHLPDTFNVIFFSSGSEDMQIGSVLLVDSLVIETNTGIIDLWDPPTPLHVYPNPAVDRVNFVAGEEAEKRELIVFDANGKLITKADFPGKTAQLNIQSFKPGLFTYVVIQNNRHVFGGSFLKK